MIERKEIEMMKVAYRQLYEIDNALRNFISIRMDEEYGPFWFTKAPKILQRNLREHRSTIYISMKWSALFSVSIHHLRI